MIRVWNFSIAGPRPRARASTKARILASKTSRRCASALARSASLSKRVVSRVQHGRAQRLGAWARGRRGRVRPCSTVSAPPPSPKTTAGPAAGHAPRAGTMPKSSTPGISTARQPRYSSRSSSSLTRPRKRDLGRGERAQARRPPGRCRRCAAAGRCRGRPRARGRAACRARGPRRRGRTRPAASAPGREEVGVDRRRDHDRVAAVVAADAPGDVGAVRGEAVDPARRWRRPRRAGRAAAAGTTSRPSGPSAAGAEVVVVAVPDVAHRRVAVAEVDGARGRPHALRHAVRARERRGRSRAGRSARSASGKSGR